MGINFPATPTVGQKYPQPAVAGIPVYTWDGEKWTTVGGSIAAYAPPADAVPLVNAGAGLVGTSTDYAREDHVHPTDTSRASYDALAYSGMQVNGGMEVSQELGGTGTASGYVCDMWQLIVGGLSLGSATQGAGPLFPGFPSRIYVNVGVGKPALAAGDLGALATKIEGYRIIRLQWGTANAQPITLGFWTAHHRPGLYSGAVQNNGGTRSYVFTYTQNIADVAQYNVITIPGDTTGTWALGNVIGMSIWFTVASGTNFIAPTANVWAAGNYLAASGHVNGVTTTSDISYFAGVTILPGTQAPTAAQSPNIMRPYDQELVTCKRYYEQSWIGTSPAGNAAGCAVAPWSSANRLVTGGKFSVEKRVAPTWTHYSPAGGGAGVAWIVGVTEFGMTPPSTTASGWGGNCDAAGLPNATAAIFHWKADARL